MKSRGCTAGAPSRSRTLIALGIASFWAIIAVLATAPLPGEASVGSASAANPIRGKGLFDKRCGGCHSLDNDKEGPRLRGVYGRKAGSTPTFNYSCAMKSAQFTWDASALNRWLTDTESVVPDNDMDFQVPKADERADIIEFLKVSSGK